MAGVIYAVLGLLAAEDLKYKAVAVWKLVLFGAVCVIQAAVTGILTQSIETDTFLGVLFGIAALLICVWSNQLGAADGMVLLFLALACGGVRIVGIFAAALSFMGICVLVLLALGRIHKKTTVPVIPFIFLAAVWRGL
mgnify:CR=1 FL=1